MALLVNDPNDPSGGGMFSKPGRFTSEKYIVFQKKDEIMANQRKFYKITSVLNLNFDPTKDQDKKPEEDDPNRFHTSPNVKSRPLISPMAVALSREDVAKAKNKKQIAPAGHYNPKYNYVEKNPNVLFNYKNETPKDRPLMGPDRSNFIGDDSGTAFFKVKRKVFGSHEWHKQPDRVMTFYPKEDESGGDRFGILNETLVSSKIRRVPSVSLAKNPGRDRQNKFYKEEVFAPDYDPKWEIGRKKAANVISFGLMSSRKPLNPKGLNIETQYNPEPIIHIRTPKIDKYTPRMLDPDLPLPSFMQVERFDLFIFKKPITSRMAIEQLNQKVLEINANGDSKFFNTSKGFSSRGFSSKMFTGTNTARSTFQSPKDRLDDIINIHSQ